MATEKRLIYMDDTMDKLMAYAERKHEAGHTEQANGILKAVNYIHNNIVRVDAVEVVHGRWESCGGDLHSSGYAISCSICNRVHFVHRKYSLGGLNCKELFEKPKYCPSCGAVMDGKV